MRTLLIMTCIFLVLALSTVQAGKKASGHKGNHPEESPMSDAAIEKRVSPETLPLVCYQVERDELRQLLVDWIKRKSVENDTPYLDTTRTMFRDCDVDTNQVLDADEFLRCTERGDLDVKDTDAHILRGLCIDALISIASRHHNWVLTEREFQHLLEPNYVPPTKVCQLEDKKYVDGAETKVDCNVCVCACGDWVCTGAPCGDVKRTPGAPGPVTQGPLPTENQRETFLRGFKAADDVYIPAVLDQVASKQRSRDVAEQLNDLDKDKPQ